MDGLKGASPSMGSKQIIRAGQTLSRHGYPRAGCNRAQSAASLTSSPCGQVPVMKCWARSGSPTKLPTEICSTRRASPGMQQKIKSKIKEGPNRKIVDQTKESQQLWGSYPMNSLPLGYLVEQLSEVAALRFYPSMRRKPFGPMQLHCGGAVIP